MSRKARHLLVLEESKKEEFNLDKPSKIKSRFENVQDARYDEARQQANIFAKSMGIEIPPNKLSYEKGGKKRRTQKKYKGKKRYNTRSKKNRK